MDNDQGLLDELFIWQFQVKKLATDAGKIMTQWTQNWSADKKKRSISAITMANDCWLFPVLPQNPSAIGCFLKCDWGFIQELCCITANWFLTVSCIYWYIRPSWCTVGHFKILNFTVLYITAQNIEVYGWSLSLQKQTWTKTQV